MTRQAFKTTDRLRLEVGIRPTDPTQVNHIKNPSGERGSWGWITPPADVAISAAYLDGSSAEDIYGGGSLTFNASGPSGVIAYFVSEPAAKPDPAGPSLPYVVAATRLKAAIPAGRAAEISLVFYDAAGVATRTAVQAIPGGSANLSVHRTAPTTWPAGAVKVAMRLDSLGATAGARTLAVDRNFMSYHPTTTSANAAFYSDPYSYTNYLTGATEITIDRAALSPGTMTVTSRDGVLDPALNAILRPGVPVRLRAAEADGFGSIYANVFRPIFTGFVDKAAVAYDLAHPDPAKRARIVFTATDGAKRLANMKQPIGVATVEHLRYLMEGCGVPWKINGTNNNVPGAPALVSRNENASVLDQIAITRDSKSAHAWVDNLGTMCIYEAGIMGTTTQAVLSEADYRADIDVNYDTARCINVVTVKRIAYDAVTGQTVETVFGPYRDEASVTKWGPFSEEFTVHGLTDAAVPGYAAAILTANANPKVRCNGLTMAITSNPQFQSGSGPSGVQKRVHLDLYDRVQVNNTRAGLTEVMRVSTIKHEIRPEKWIVSVGFASTGGVALPSPAPDLGPTAQSFPDTAWAPIPYANGWQPHDPPSWGVGRYRRKNGVVYVQMFANSGYTPATSDYIAQLPVGFRVGVQTLMDAGRGGAWAQIVIQTDGWIKTAAAHSSTYWTLHATWVADQ